MDDGTAQTVPTVRPEPKPPLTEATDPVDTGISIHGKDDTGEEFEEGEI